MSSITSASKVGEIVASNPSASKALYVHGIDFCCGGGASLQSVCEKKQLNVNEVLESIDRAIQDQDPSEIVWADASVPAVIGHIMISFHEPLRQELPRLQMMLEKVVKVHGHYDPERLNLLLKTFTTFHRDLITHMLEEEEQVFPALMQNNASAVSSAIAELEKDHQSAGEALEQFRELTDNFVPPEFACNTWRALWAGLESLEKEMHQHVHMENNVLFPKAAISG